MTSLLSLIALLSVASSKNAKVGPEIFVRTHSKVSIERLAAAVRPMGRIEERVRGTHDFLVQLNLGVDDEKAKQRLEQIPGVRALEPREEPFDMNSIRSLDRKLAHLRSDEEHAEARNPGQIESGADYLEAYRYFLGIRASPHDTFDWSSIDRAKKHARQMPPTVFPGMQTGGHGPSSFQPWEFIGPTNLATPPNAVDCGIGPVNGRVNAVAFDPNNSQIIYAGAAQGGLWKSSNGGTSWTWLSASWSSLGVNCIAVDPLNSAVIYVGLGDYHGGIGSSHGMMKTTDGGQTWAEIATEAMGPIGVASILIDPTNDQIIIAGAGNGRAADTVGGGIYQSTNGGQSWTLAQIGDQFPSIAASVPNAGSVRFYAVTGGEYVFTGSRLYYSDDHGKTWQNLPNCPAQQIDATRLAYSVATSPTNPNNVYVLDAQDQGLYVSSDRGNTWTDRSSDLPVGPNTPVTDYNFSQSYYDYYLACGNRANGTTNADVLYLGLIDIQESLDQGQTWQSIGGPAWLTAAQGGITHTDQHCFASCPTNPNLFLFSNDGGVYELSYTSPTNTNTITSLNGTLGNTMFYKIACHPTNPNWIMGGAQDNSTPFASSSFGQWDSWGYGDGGGVAINQTNPAIAFSTAEKTHVFRMNNGISSETDISPTIPATERLPFVTPIALDPQNQSILYTGTNFLYKWDDDAQAWTPDVGGADLTAGGGVISAITVAPTDSMRIYVGSSDGEISWTGDGGNTWHSIQNPQPYVWITSISVNPTDENDILVGFGNPFVNHLYRTTNATTSGFTAWTSLDGSGATALPGASLNAIARDLDDPLNTWYVATDAGIFQTSNAGTSWTNAGTAYGLPDVIVDDLVAVPGTRYLNAGTYGRGMWRLYLPDGGASLTGLTISPNSVVGGASAVGTVAVSKPAPTGGTVITLTSSSEVTCPSSITVPAGSTSANFGITTSETTANFQAGITAIQGGIIKTAFLDVEPVILEPIVLVPSTVFGGADATGELLLDGPAPTGGIKVLLASSNATVKVPASVTIAAGATSATFKITTVLAATTITSNITARAGNVTQTATLTVQTATLQGVSLSASSVVGGSDTVLTGTLTFNGPTTAAGIVVKLTSSNTLAATVPASVFVKLDALQRTASFTVTHLPVTYSEGLVISATCGGVLYSADLQVNPFQIESITADPSSIVGGSKAVGTVTLNAKPGAKSGSQTVHLQKSASVIGIPLACSVPIGATTGAFTVTSSVVSADTSAIITGKLGASSQQATVTVEAARLESIAVKPTSVVGGSTTIVTGGVLLTGPAPAGGIVAKLTSSDPTIVRVPSSVTVLAGRSSATFKVSHVKVAQAVTVTLTATYGGSDKTTTLLVKV